ncbi:MAG TPA: M28 family peptidase [Allosphingosinicella sp.]|jgi:hypothetical protein
MSSRVISSLAPLLALLAAAPAAAQPPQAAPAPISEAELRRHVEVLASDRFEGRKPGTAGERLTTDYIIRELASRGVEPAAAGGGWLQPVALVERGTARHQLRWTHGDRQVDVPADAVVLTTRDAAARIAGAPVIFAGHGAVMPERGINQLAGADLRGAVALILYEGPQVEGFPSFTERLETLAAAGAVAVIGIVGPDLPFDQVRRFSAGGSVQLDRPGLPTAFGAISWEGAATLVRGAGLDLQRLLDDQPGSSFRSVPLRLRADIQAEGEVRRFTSNNVIGRIRGSGRTSESLVLLGHWDHLGLCRPEGAADRICNGAVDNASGIAVLIEAAGRLAAGARPQRDILILATTAEEMGLLGAEFFARNPPVPRRSIVAGINVDTLAVAPAGTPVAVIGGTPAMDMIIGRVAIGLGRRLDSDREADIMATRQDGWALTRNGIPTFMAVSNASDMALLRAFLSGTYHGPDDEPSSAIQYGGAVEDANLLVALARAFADPAQYAAPAPAPGERG